MYILKYFNDTCNNSLYNHKYYHKFRYKCHEIKDECCNNNIEKIGLNLSINKCYNTSNNPKYSNMLLECKILYVTDLGILIILYVFLAIIILILSCFVYNNFGDKCQKMYRKIKNRNYKKLSNQKKNDTEINYSNPEYNTFDSN